ncbi:AtpZ/AtpI family protein [Emticicia agri]|uniref:AtpZ/AtpI family protein n=1 Tax=Emticicia agri TaxID=2492393 RepID=A0A4V1ZCK6_9BACT|nr:AtpZ/AtpI family protein [Emticicia agri]RYU92990.1 AtpZ/AtpI family protein [Emticicia agri]
MEENNDMKNTKTWLKFTQIGLQMILTIGLGTWFGYWLDGRAANKTPVWTLVLSLTSIGISLYNVIRQLPKQ